MRILRTIMAVALAFGGATFAVAQHQHRHDASVPRVPDPRQFVKFPAALAEDTLANMRDHLQALQEISATRHGSSRDCRRYRGNTARDVVVGVAWRRGGFQIHAAGDAGCRHGDAPRGKPVCDHGSGCGCNRRPEAGVGGACRHHGSMRGLSRELPDQIALRHRPRCSLGAKSLPTAPCGVNYPKARIDRLRISGYPDIKGIRCGFPSSTAGSSSP